MRLVGLNLADAAVFMTVAQTLSVFEVSKKVRDGIVIEPDCEYEAGTVRCVTSLPAFPKRLVLKVFPSHPKKFQCSIKPRSDKARELIVLEGEK